MRKTIINSLAAVALSVTMASCGDSWLETDLPNGVDTETALNNVDNIGYALNGTYYQLMRYYFAGNYGTTIGDLASDLVYWSRSNGHQTELYQFTYTDTDNSIYYIWDYGYKVVDAAARVIQATEALLPEVSGEDAEYLKLYEAEARCLRAYANLVMVNVYCHQAKVVGQDFTSMPGLVIVDEPIEAYADVERASIGQTYSFIIGDLQKAVSLFAQVGDRGDLNYFGEASAYGLLARANVYMENWGEAASAARNALSISGIDELAYTPAAYKALYNNAGSNWESMFALAIDNLTNWSANSCGTLFTTYGYSSSPYLESLYGNEDCRLSIIYFTGAGYNNDFSGGKFGYYGGSNPALATNYLINAPEMYLIEAEAYANQSQIAQAQDALLVVAMRNPEITSTDDLPATKEGILSFLRDERARELFQEGLRLWDLRRWGGTVNLYATGAPEINWVINNADITNQVFPIPADEINAGFGVTQNDGWSSNRPR